MLYTSNFLDTFLSSFLTFFATVSPINCLIIFMSLTAKYKPQDRKKIAITSCLVASVILVTVMLVGEMLFKFLGIGIPAVRTAGGVLLLLTAISMMFGEDRESDGVGDVKELKKDISVFPLAVPVIAGPAAITTSILLEQSYQSVTLKLAVLFALLCNLALTIILLLLSGKIIHRIKKSVIGVFLRLAGLILSSLAIQFIFDGLRESGIF